MGRHCCYSVLCADGKKWLEKHDQKIWSDEPAQVRVWEMRWWFLKCNHRRTDKCGGFLLYFLIFLSHFHFSLMLHSTCKVLHNFFYCANPNRNQHAAEKTGICVFLGITWKNLEKKCGKTRCEKFYSNSYKRTHARTFHLIFCMWISYFRFVYVGYQALLFIVAVIFQSVFSLSDMLFAKHSHTRSSEHLVELGQRQRNTWWKTPAWTRARTHKTLCCVLILMRCVCFTSKRYNNFDVFFYSIHRPSFLFFSLPFLSFLFGVSHPFFLFYLIRFFSFLCIVLYTEGIFNNNGK